MRHQLKGLEQLWKTQNNIKLKYQVTAIRKLKLKWNNTSTSSSHFGSSGAPKTCVACQFKCAWDRYLLVCKHLQMWYPQNPILIFNGLIVLGNILSYNYILLSLLISSLLFLIWLVVYLPLWKIWVRQLGWWHSQYILIHTWKNKSHVPNHQPNDNGW